MTARIDSHQHFWKYAAETHDWIGPHMAGLRRDFLPTDLAPALTAAGYSGCIAVQAAGTEAETSFLLELGDAHDFIVGVVGWINLLRERVRDRIDLWAQHPKLVGIRHIAQSESDPRWLARPEVQAAVGQLARHRLSYDLLVYEHQLPAAITLVRAVPQARFVLDHLGKPEIRARELEPWRTRIFELAALPNVAAKLSGLITEADWAHWTRDDLRPYVEVALEAFGPSRLLIGSDWPVGLLAAADYRAIVQPLEDLVASLSASERAAILGGNVATWYPRLGNQPS